MVPNLAGLDGCLVGVGVVMGVAVMVGIRIYVRGQRSWSGLVFPKRGRHG